MSWPEVLGAGFRSIFGKILGRADNEGRDTGVTPEMTTDALVEVGIGVTVGMIVDVAVGGLVAFGARVWVNVGAIVTVRVAVEVTGIGVPQPTSSAMTTINSTISRFANMLASGD